MLTTSVTPAVIATAMGRPAPASGSLTEGQWNLWISDATRLIQKRVDSMDPAPTLDQEDLDYVVRLAVTARIERPANGAVQVSTTVDDSTVQESYRDAYRPPEVTIADKWWDLLGLGKGRRRAFMVDLMPPREP